MKIKARWQRR